ncbi:MAG TPA: TIR domain-containing protein [Clostridia bacterium]|nr:TIR domain-containing protein [Clostridia bacterium]
MKSEGKPKLFVGSSKEGLPYANAIQAKLQDVAEVTLWTDNVFRSNDGNLEALLKALSYFDFAVFALTPDDTITSRDKSQKGPRDNALFEFGLFLGRLGPERCFAVAPAGDTIKLPSDLHGVTIARYENDRADNNIKAAVSSACTMIRDEIQKALTSAAASATVPEKENLKAPVCSHAQSAPVAADNDSMLELLGFDNDVSVELGTLNEDFADWFHSDRFVQAFPGVRGAFEITDSKTAIERLTILLRNPLTWRWYIDGGTASADPIWWWRGTRNMYIDRFSLISEREMLLHSQELPIKRVIAFNPGEYWQSFVYIEANPKPATGLYQPSAQEKDWMMKTYGYVSEEYGLYLDRPVTRAEYDDGAALIDGKPSRIPDAKLRVRYLTPYNLVIASKMSPINNKQFDSAFGRLMNGILDGESTLNDLVEAIKHLPRRTPQGIHRLT